MLRVEREPDMKCALLTIGSEVASGQILNSNAQWVAQKVEALGVEVVASLAVPDRIDAICEALEWVSPNVEWIVVTGGLGPTRDDLTRDAVSSWTGRPLTLVPEAWEHIQKIFERRGRIPQEFQRSGAMILEGSKYLPNTIGTAASFYFDRGHNFVVVLPGPPRELQEIWNSYVDGELKQRAPADPRVLWTWLTLGRGESEVVDMIEAPLENYGLKEGRIEIGYRLTSPFVEIKIWATAKFEYLYPEIDRCLRTQLGPSFFCAGSVGFWPELAKKLNAFEGEVFVYDGLAHWPLARKFMEAQLPSNKKIIVQGASHLPFTKMVNAEPFLQFELNQVGANKFEWTLVNADFSRMGNFKNVFPVDMIERNSKAAAELAIREFVDVLSSMS